MSECLNRFHRVFGHRDKNNFGDRIIYNLALVCLFKKQAAKRTHEVQVILFHAKHQTVRYKVGRE